MNDILMTLGGGGGWRNETGGGNVIRHWLAPADQRASVRHLTLRVVAPYVAEMLQLKLLTINIVTDVAGFLTVSSLHTSNFGTVPPLVAPKRSDGGPKSE
jgi:hypothetical protein